jgi:hypothetical protein
MILLQIISWRQNPTPDNAVTMTTVAAAADVSAAVSTAAADVSAAVLATFSTTS